MSCGKSFVNDNVQVALSGDYKQVLRINLSKLNVTIQI